MAPNTDHVVSSQSIDIRVPPIFITDPSVFQVFPDLISENESLHVPYTPKFETAALLCPNQIELPRQETASSPSNSYEYFVGDFLQDDDFLLEDASESHKYSPVHETANDLFHSDYVLPANTDWWQLSDSETEDFHLTATPGDTEFDLVDVPHFGDSLSNSDLWEDVDTFVSVVDVSTDDVIEAREVHEPVYCLDTKVSTVWGLDIIWEEEE